MRQVVAEEMLQRPVFKDKSAVFNERFAATLCGRNSSIGTCVAEGFVNTLPKGEINRRNFVEVLHTNPICALPPAAWVSRSEKLEHGRSRPFSPVILSIVYTSMPPVLP